MSVAGIDLSVLDLVKEVTQTTGTGAYVLDGAPSGFQSFASVGDGKVVPYVVRFGSEWETGVGAITVGATNSLSRTSILDSSSGGAAVNWGVGVKDIRIDVPADWFAKLRPSQVQLQPPSNGNDVVIVKNASGVNRVVGSIAADGSGDFNVRNAGGTTTVALDGSAGSVAATGAVSAASMAATGVVSGSQLQISGSSITPQLAKGWVKFTPTASIQASHNVSSITDHGSGDWSVNWSTPFATVHYAASTSINVDTTGAVRMSVVRIQSAGALRVNTFSTAGVGELNVTDIYVIAFGSQ